MKNLASIIREMRERRGETQAAFARRLGIKHGAVSRYELGKLAPGRAVLINLLGLAESAEDRKAIRAAIGDLPDDLAKKEEAFIALAHDVETRLNEVIRQQGTSIATREAFRDLAVDAIGQKYVPLWLVEMLKLWRRYRADREAEAVFTDALSSIDRALEELRRKR